jgi:hypothetical protein
MPKFHFCLFRPATKNCSKEQTLLPTYFNRDASFFFQKSQNLKKSLPDGLKESHRSDKIEPKTNANCILSNSIRLLIKLLNFFCYCLNIFGPNFLY